MSTATATVPSTELTPRQAEILRSIIEHHRKHGRCPTRREIGTMHAISSPNGVMCHLYALEKKGYIGINPNTARSLIILKPPREYIALPALFVTAREAGELIETLTAEVARRRQSLETAGTVSGSVKVCPQCRGEKVSGVAHCWVCEECDFSWGD